MKRRVLIVDDDEAVRAQMKWALAGDYEVVLAEDRAGAVAAFDENHPIAVVLDLGLPPSPSSPEEGLALLNTLLANDPQAKVIVATGLSDRDTTLRALKRGAYDFVSKPVESEHLRVILGRAFQLAELERNYREMLRRSEDSFEGMFGTSPAMREVFASIRKLAAIDSSVLLLGESGVGKETAARAIHRNSRRKEGPFVVVNCGAIPAALIESELFGHEKGAFPGAHTQRQGRIELSQGGTLFLDGVDEVPASMQVKLFQFLRERRLQRLAANEEIEVDVRVVSAANGDLKKAVLKRDFREDLFDILSVRILNLPPLRERGGDIEPLAHLFLQQTAAQEGKGRLTFHAEALAAMNQYHWPGNIRELAECVKRAVVVTQSEHITKADLDLGSPAKSSTTTLRKAREAVEREVIVQALERNNQMISRAAAELGISRPTLYDLMDKLGILKTKDKESTADELTSPQILLCSPKARPAGKS